MYTHVYMYLYVYIYIYIYICASSVTGFKTGSGQTGCVSYRRGTPPPQFARFVRSAHISYAVRVATVWEKRGFVLERWDSPSAHQIRSCRHRIGSHRTFCAGRTASAGPQTCCSKMYSFYGN